MSRLHYFVVGRNDAKTFIIVTAIKSKPVFELFRFTVEISELDRGHIDVPIHASFFFPSFNWGIIGVDVTGDTEGEFTEEQQRMIKETPALFDAGLAQETVTTEVTEEDTNLTEKQKAKAKKEQKTRAQQSRASRRSGKSMKTEGKVTKSTSKAKEARSSKKIAAIKKRTRS